jgi:hypothetical protein
MRFNNTAEKNVRVRRMALHELIHLKPISLLEKVMVITTPMRFLKKQTAAFVSRFSGLSVIESSVEKNITIHPYEGTNTTALALRNLVLSQVKDDILDIIVHGSIADGSVCSYSDFDCLIILNDDVIQSEQRLCRLAFKLWKWQKLMLNTDLLQHHGWFVAFQSDFKSWDQTYLPVEVLSCSKSLLRKNEYLLKIFTNTGEDFSSPFIKLFEELSAITEIKIRRMNSYEIKGFISRFFLMPSLYYQARYKTGVYKRDSFILAQKDFPVHLWQPVSELSRLRTEWKQVFSTVTGKLINIFYLWPTSLKKPVYPRAPEAVYTSIIQNLPAIKALLLEMKKKLNN